VIKRVASLLNNIIYSSLT